MTIIRTIEGAPADFSPGVYAESNGGGPIVTDPSGALKTRGATLTDEGGYRSNFSGTSLFYTFPNCTFTNGSNLVTTTSGFSSESVHVGDYMKLSADADSYLIQIEYIHSDTSIGLSSPYTGTSATGNGSVSKVVIETLGSGTSYSIANGNLSVLSGTVSGSYISVERKIDYIPVLKQTSLMLSQRNPNQTIVLGLYDNVNVTPQYWVWFKFTGTDNTIVTCEGAFDKLGAPSLGEIESISVKLPSGLTTAQPLRYRIEALQDKLRFLINGNVVAELYKSIPNPYSTLTSIFRIINDTTVGVATTATLDYDSVQNFNKIMSSPINDSDPTGPTTNDMETLIDLFTQLLSKTAYADTAGRTRVSIESATNVSCNTNQVGGQNIAISNGVTGNGVARIFPAYESISMPPQNLAILYSAISTS